jgi:hypothetical protein
MLLSLPPAGVVVQGWSPLFESWPRLRNGLAGTETANTALTLTTHSEDTAPFLSRRLHIHAAR